MLNSDWQQFKKITAPAFQCFMEALDRPEIVQQKVLAEVLSRNVHSEYGQLYRFKNIDSIAKFQKEVPIQCDQLSTSLTDRMILGDQNVLVSDSVLWFEKTSGTSAKPKIVPYTKASLNAMQSALFPWLYDLYTSHSKISQGKAYWSISPAGQTSSNTTSGVPIGVSNDAMYFGQEAAQLITNALAVPAWVGQLTSINAWQYATLRYLLATEDLRLISIWSPTFLLQLLKAIPDHANMLVDDIARGIISHPGLAEHNPIDPIKPDPARSKVIADCIFKPQIDYQKLWPELALISCWSSASSATYARQLQQLFPAAYLQAKGLLATEGVISLPLDAAKDPVLALLSGFYEFVTDDGSIHLAHELKTGICYSVLMTNHSGFYRYPIGDRVLVTGWLKNTPCLKFIGRSKATTDLCGEKLTEDFVLPFLDQIPGFSLLVANPLPEPHYCLYVDAATINASKSVQLAIRLDQQLRQNPHYQYARHLKQLGTIKVIRTSAPMNSYYQKMNQEMVLGDIKPPSISQHDFWHDSFEVVGG